MLIKILCLVAVLAACEGRSSRVTRNVNVNKYYIYTQDTHREPVPLNENDLANTGIVPDDPTVVVIHGHAGSAFTSLNPMVINALLSSEKVNIIVVDWSVYASLSYSNAVVAVPSVGVDIARILSLLAATNPIQINFNQIHIVGFGLGAHIAGFVGRELQLTYERRPARITGLDPSGSQWTNNPQRLGPSDACYVEAIHTDGSGINSNGIGIRVGHVDFFVNGGGNQPGCSNNACSHNRAFEIFSSSLTHGGLVGRQCDSNLQLNLNLCRGFTLNVGNNAMNKFGDGMFRVNTGKSYPF